MAKQYGMKAEDYAMRKGRPERGCSHATEDFESCADMQGAQHCVRCRPICVFHDGYPNAYVGAGKEWFTDRTVGLSGPGFTQH